ncbi:MAG: glycosyltransferase family 9 protein [Deltaproteobacteria bacterium]|nr:glycosyltransferase family 9 protein [Deltaproteobacteria bacterium]
MHAHEGIEKILQLAKQFQRRFLFADYEELDRRQRWLEPDAHLPFRQISMPILPSAEQTRTILVFKPDDIGDAVYSLPAAMELRESFPRSRIFLLCQEKTASLFERTALFDEISSIPVSVRFFRFPFFDLQGALKKFSKQEFDIAVFLRTYPVYFKPFLRIPCKIHLHPLDPRMRSKSAYQARITLWGSRRAHQSVQLLQIVAGLTGKKYSSTDIRFPKLQWTDSDQKALEITFGKTVPERFLVIHPYARYETRDYPKPYWQTVVNEIKRTFGYPIVVIGSVDDPKTEFPAIETQGKLSLSQTAYLISKASAFVGSEAGPVHLAAMLGIPVVALFGGHSSPAEWGPLGKSLILRADVPCSPCHRRVCPGYGLVCLKELTPQRVLPEIETFLRSELRIN